MERSCKLLDLFNFPSLGQANLLDFTIPDFCEAISFMEFVTRGRFLNENRTNLNLNN